MFNKKNINIKFISSIPGLSDVEECIPKPANKFTPTWWKEIPMIKTDINVNKKESPGNIKNCPSFPDYFSNGYIMPMWTDTILYVDSESGIWKARQANENKFSVSIHPKFQYLDYVNHKFMNKDTYFIFKLNSPWYILTDPGYSIYQLPVFYHFNEDFSILPGIIDNDIYHQSNLQMLIHSDKKEIFIPRGTPLAQYFVYKRENSNIVVKDQDSFDSKLINKFNMSFSTKFQGTKTYQKMRKERDKNV